MLPISGYTAQSDQNVQIVNYNKQIEEMILRMCDSLGSQAGAIGSGEPYDAYWLSIARTHFEQGFMALNRSIFQPQRVKISMPIEYPADKE